MVIQHNYHILYKLIVFDSFWFHQYPLSFSSILCWIPIEPLSDAGCIFLLFQHFLDSYLVMGLFDGIFSTFGILNYAETFGWFASMKGVFCGTSDTEYFDCFSRKSVRLSNLSISQSDLDSVNCLSITAFTHFLSNNSCITLITNIFLSPEVYVAFEKFCFK